MSDKTKVEKSKKVVGEVSGADVDMNERAEFQVLPAAGPVVMDDSAFDDEQQGREEAFQSDPSWRGELLQPFSISRESFFYQLRKAVGAPVIYECLEDSSAFLADALRILYLCSHDPSEWRHLRSSPALLMEMIEQWAEESITANEQVDAVTVALTLFNQAHANAAQSVPVGNPGDEESLGN